MAYLKEPQDIERLRECFARPRFVSQTLSIEFTTTREFAREVLPPCFDLAAEPLGYVSIAQYQSTGMGDFPCGWVHLMAKYGETEGIFPIASYFGDTTDTTWIREVWGEPGKAAKTAMFEDGDRRFAYSERKGVRIIEMEAELGAEQITAGPLEMPSNYFEVKLVLSARDGGLEFDPAVVVMDVEEEATSYRTGAGGFDLRGTPFDPLDEIPVVTVGEASWKVSSSRYEITAYDSLEDRDAYLPWAYADRYWDDPRLLTVPRRFAAGA
ncbi:MAG: acetoacetate decarboxylase family protein [Actinobacteria bacterium]|nr:acetoacetate decarboxylase family protein [Actinomycetota bacterium]